MPVSIDLAAEPLIAATKDDRKIAVEVKSFISSSQITDFYAALGQYLTYRVALKLQEPERELYLAVPKLTYELHRLDDRHSIGKECRNPSFVKAIALASIRL